MEELYVCWEQHFDDPIWIQFAGTEKMFEKFSQRFKELKVDTKKEIFENVVFSKDDSLVNWRCYYKREHIASVYTWLDDEKITETWGKIGHIDIGFNFQKIEINQLPLIGENKNIFIY